MFLNICTFRVGFAAGIIFMIMVPTHWHNAIREPVLRGVSWSAAKIFDIAEEEQKYEVEKVLRTQE